MPKVLITSTLPQGVLEPLRGLAEVIQGPESRDFMPRSQVLSLAPELDAIINQTELRIDAELLDRAPKLKIVANVAAGIDNLDLPLMAERGVWGTNAGDVFVESTADCTLGMLLCLVRRLAEGDRFIRSGGWKRFEIEVWDGMLLRGKTLGIVGYGRTGRAVAKRAGAFGMEVIHTRRTDTGEAGYRALDALLAEADFVSLHTPLTPQTHHLMDAERLGRMKRGAFLINMARGPVVDETALVAALEGGHLGGAGMDVFEYEPKVHPALLRMPNVVMSPHLGGATHESRRAARLLCTENVALVLRGKRPRTPVNELEHP